MAPVTEYQLNQWFTYHAPDEADKEAYRKIRDAGLALAKAIIENTPQCADQTAAIRKVREGVATANAARACGGV